MTGHWVTGDHTGLRFPADPAALQQGGAQFLTDAFRAAGTLAPGNAVLEVTGFTEVSGGSTGRKALLTLRYADDAGLPEELFVKFSRDYDDPIRDRGRAQMEYEVRFAALAATPGFPIDVPATQFADYHRGTGTGILITQRIRFGANGIEPQYHKCLDYLMADQVGHYRALVTALAGLAGSHRAGRLPAQLIDEFPVDLQGATVGTPPELPPDKLARRLRQLADLQTDYPALLPAGLCTPELLTRLGTGAPKVLAAAPEIWRLLGADPNLIALCHWNANVDNAWFFLDPDGALRCGLLDWGCVGQLNVAMALWGALSAAETELWEQHFDDLLDTFATEFGRRGGPALDRAELRLHLVLYAVLMGTQWLLDVPARLRSHLRGRPPTVTRTDPPVSDDESLRAPLQMLANVLHLWNSHPVGRYVDDAAHGHLRKAADGIGSDCGNPLPK